MDADIEGAASAIAGVDATVAFTGAGASTESGLPDFRGPGGLWERYDPDVFHIRSFEADPASFWGTWLELRAHLVEGSIEPNPAHGALATLEAAGHLEAVITQNVDGLHADAGSESVLELHGNATRTVCVGCDRRAGAAPAVARARDGERPPRCPECGGPLKPDTVLFGEALPRRPLLRARSLAERCDVFVVVGSSVTVEPAASLPRTALEHGATLVVVNAEPTPVCDRAAYTFREPAGEVLPRLASEAEDVGVA